MLHPSMGRLGTHGRLLQSPVGGNPGEGGMDARRDGFTSGNPGAGVPPAPSLDISYTNLSKVEAELLGGVVARLEAADLGCTSLRVEQVEAILTSILHTSSLASLWISGVQGKVDRDLVNQAHMVVPQLRVL